MILRAAQPLTPARECPDRKELDAFVHGDLPPDARRRLEAHRRQCPHCQKIITVFYRNNDLPYSQPMR